jgi:membrane protein required for beta-lactamase induction
MKSIASRSRQKGLSFIGLVLIVAILVAVVGIGAQSLPVFLEYQAAVKAANKAASEGNSTVAEVRSSFDRAASIDNINSVSGADLHVTKVNDKVVVGFEYSREIHLAGPAYLVYRFKK